MGTVTTYSHCLIKGDKGYEGTKEEIVSKICKWRLSINNTLFVQFNGYKEYMYHSYNNEFTKEEIYRDIINFIFNKSSEIGYSHYRNLGF